MYFLHGRESTPPLCCGLKSADQHKGSYTIVLFTENGRRPLLQATGRQNSGELASELRKWDNLNRPRPRFHLYNEFRTTSFRIWIREVPISILNHEVGNLDLFIMVRPRNTENVPQNRTRLFRSYPLYINM